MPTGKTPLWNNMSRAGKNRIMKQDSWGSPAPADQAGCEAISGTWNAALSVCTAGLDNPANENDGVHIAIWIIGSGNPDPPRAHLSSNNLLIKNMEYAKLYQVLRSSSHSSRPCAWL